VTGQPGATAGSVSIVNRWRFSGWLIGASALVLALIAPALGVEAAPAAVPHSVSAPVAPLGGPCPVNGSQCNGGHLLPVTGVLVGGLLATGLAGLAVAFRPQRPRRRRTASVLPDGVPAAILRPPRTFLADA
jgi:hypothetical protein